MKSTSARPIKKQNRADLASEPTTATPASPSNIILTRVCRRHGRLYAATGTCERCRTDEVRP